MHVAGNAVLATFLTVAINGSFKPTEGSEYVILTANSIDTTFLQYDHLTPGDHRIRVSNDADGEIGSFDLFDRVSGPGEYELVVGNYHAAPEPSLLSLSLLIPFMLRPRKHRSA